MALLDLKAELTEEVRAIIDSNFKITITETVIVPDIDDTAITYPNLVTKEQKCKLIETCVLYIDIRNSTELNNAHQRPTLAKLYSAFVRSMTKCGGYYGGKVRNIVGDRVMVLFDKNNCFKNAVNTAILMNSVSQYIINKNFPHNEIKCGIGIDYGKMLVVKAGIIKQGAENTSNKSLVWLGRPANVASKLTDIAKKTTSIERKVVREGYWYRYTDKWFWPDCELDTFVGKLKTTASPNLIHPDANFASLLLGTATRKTTTSSILMTEAVYTGYALSCPNEKGIKEGWWAEEKPLVLDADALYALVDHTELLGQVKAVPVIKYL